MEQTIFAQIRKENSDFFNLSISPVPGYSFNQYETIKRCHLYNNSKYEDGSTILGREKLFFNVVNPPCEVATKLLNVDTKNIRLTPTNDKSQFATSLLEKDLKQWLKTTKFPRILNKIAEQLPIFGSAVIEKVNDGAKFIDIRHLILDPTVETIQKSRFVTTIHYMTPSELRETKWDNVEQAIKMFGDTNTQAAFEDASGDLNMQQSTPYIKVMRRFGEVPEWWIDGGKSEKTVKAMFIVAGVDLLSKNQEGKVTGDAGTILYKSKWRTDWPFKDFHYIKTDGRWLGRGVIEMLFDVQERVNEMKNQKRISMEISALHLFQSADKNIVRNALTDLLPGDILRTTGITPLANEERNLAAFKDEEQSYRDQVEKLTFSYESVRGETPSSSTPLGTTQIVTAQATSVFGFKKENIEISLRDFFNELVTPQMIKDLSAEHILIYTGSAQEIRNIDDIACQMYANEKVSELLFKGNYESPEQVDELKQKFINEHRKKGSARFIKVKEYFYKDAEFKWDFIIGSEAFDPQTQAQNYGKVIMDLANAPQILQDPRMKLLYYKYAEILGIDPTDLDAADQEAQALQANQQQNGQLQQGQPDPRQGIPVQGMGAKPQGQAVPALAGQGVR
jgi:hypothetical protein